MNLKDLKRLLALMAEHDLAEIEVEEGGRRVKFRKQELRSAAAVPFPASPQPEHAAPTPAALAPPESTEKPREELLTITSPMVGTFYRASSPDAEAFVEVGASVNKESVVCIIEAMKVMNEIKAEVEGRVAEILVANGEAVEYGQPLFVIEPTGG